VRLGVYADLVYRADDGRLAADRAFVKFVTKLPPRVDEIVLFGRLDPRQGPNPYPIPTEAVRFVPLPFYSSVFDVPALLRALPRSCRTFADELSQLDAVWLFGPAPLAVAFALIARRRRTPVFLGVRQDYPMYIRSRLPSRRWAWAVGAANALDLAFRLVARSSPTLTVGDELAQRYRGGHAPVLPFGLSLVAADDVVPLDAALARPWNGELRVLSVGRLDPEKNPLLLLDVIAGLRARDSRWRLAILGDGPVADDLARAVRRRGLTDAVELQGYGPNGPPLWQQSRSSHAFLHVSLTEGLPQVLFEAEAAGIPIVATSVGGVASALGHGQRGLLVPPNDPGAAIAALERLASDRELRTTLIRAGLDHISGETIEAQLDRVARFLHERLRA